VPPNRLEHQGWQGYCCGATGPVAIPSDENAVGQKAINPLGDEGKPMKLSARNQLKGTVEEVKKGQTTAHIRIDVGGAVLTASITNEAADELKLTKGMTVHAIIKASDVMVGVD
jgi:molybdopterin-binding protein